jgi:hypothetical protein
MPLSLLLLTYYYIRTDAGIDTIVIADTGSTTIQAMLLCYCCCVQGVLCFLATAVSACTACMCHSACKVSIDAVQ